jgi:hypothetical protein
MRKFLVLGLAAAAAGLVALPPDAAQSASAGRVDAVTTPGLPAELADPLGAAVSGLPRLDPDAVRGAAKPDGRSCCGEPGGTCCTTRVRAVLQDDKKKAGEAAVAKGDTARKALVEQRKALAKDGVWDCCIEPGCVFCQTAADGCPCEANLKKGLAVCPECWGGWQAGQGQVPGVNPARIPLPAADLLKKLYDMKAEKLKKAEGDK